MSGSPVTVSLSIQVLGIEVVGPLPRDFQNSVVFAAAVMNDSKHGEASRLLINFLSTPETAAVMKTKGMEPGSP